MKRSEKKELKKLMNRKEWKEWKRQHNRIDHSSWEERVRQLDMSSSVEEEIEKAEAEKVLNLAQRNARRRVAGGVLLLVVAFVCLVVGFKFR
jgi:ferric-dicitrate binding protein FerR (iron transport regulator)